MNFTAIDFETANYDRASACALGIVVVRAGNIVDSKSWLIRPPKLYFRPDFIAIHGITPEDVRDKSGWDGLWPEISTYISGQTIVAHNAPFDISVLRGMLDEYGIKHPTYDYFCSCVLARKIWPNLQNHKLNTVSDFLGIALKHHDALSDAQACAQIVIEASIEARILNLENLIKVKKIG